MKIGGMLKHAHILHSQRINEKLKQYDITMSQLNVLRYVTMANEDNVLINQKDIEMKTQLTNPTVTGLINRLESKGLLQRVTNEQDKRVKNLYITAKAQCMNKKFKSIFEESDSIALQGFNEEEKKELEKYLLRMMDNLTEDKS